MFSHLPLGGGPPAYTYANYSSVSFISTNGGYTFNAIRFSNLEQIPTPFTVQFPDGTSVPLKDLVIEQRGIERLKELESGSCSDFYVHYEHGDPVSIRVSSLGECGSNGIKLGTNGAILKFPVTRSDMERLLGNGYRWSYSYSLLK
jgi:hypothetical protein